MPIHFGVKVLGGNRGLKLTRDKYAIVSKKSSLIKFSRDIYDDDEGKLYSDDWCSQHLKQCLENYDLNMEFFSSLSPESFNQEIDSFLSENTEFNEVDDLNRYDGKPGYYIMALDEYCQLYVGTTKDIKKRIRQHWSNSKPFDRLLFPQGNVEGSMLSIDSFRAMDTTRIFAYETEETYNEEDDYINQFSPEYVSNRLGGGKITGGAIQAISMIKNRNLK
ncbi:GIY-YIG nuclease family protein (plasmid) [Rossellomorea sp. AcN35-11]|nr:GIY-YIG nuclease family protein [Rossellomorea aquimaris]WJV31903.1 GIY-YIG nuclease family protein [Rossellomorea sp. AcN35-11]